MRITAEKKVLAGNILASLFIFLFTYTAISKLINNDSFKAVLLGSEVLKWAADFLSLALPISEIIISIMLFYPVWRKTGFMFSTIMMGIFSIYISYMLLFVPDLPCSCGGIIQQMNWTQHLIFNLVFFSLGFIGWKITQDSNKHFIAINRQSRTPVQNSRQSLIN